MASSTIQPTETQVVNALENPEYVWRTVSGISKETMLPREQIVTTLKRLPKDTLVVSRNANGRKLYSTRNHYRKTQSIAGKILSVLSDRVK